MKRALIITYVWPPKGGVGVMRVLKLAKYLPALGWQPVILTSGLESAGSPYRGEDAGSWLGDIEVLRAPGREILSFLPDFIREYAVQPDLQRGWLESAASAARDLLKKTDIDLVFSSSPPETSHMIADRIKQESGIPWVADLRDMWSRCHFGRENPLKRAIAAMMEKKVLGGADLLTTVSDEWARDLASSSGVDREKIKVVTNGFDEEDFDGVPAVNPEKFTLTYTGKLHCRMQDPEVLFKALKECIQEGMMDRRRVEAKFYIMGFQRADISALARKYSLEDVVKQYPPVDYKDSLRIQRSSTALLSFRWKGAPGWYSAKIFEYIGSGKPILAYAEKGGAKTPRT